MDTKNRLIRFGFGFLLGIFLLLVMFGDRDFSCVNNYFPEGRVLQDMGRKEITFSTDISPNYQNLRDTTYFKNILLKTSSIDFDKSNTRKKPCGEYLLSNDTIQLLIQNCKKKIVVLNITPIH